MAPKETLLFLMSDMCMTSCMGLEMNKTPELLSPAGCPERLTMAVTYGADAVYLAGKLFGMRASAGNFDDEQLLNAVNYCHSNGVKVYVTCNTLPHEDELSHLPAFLELLESASVDGIIVADLGVFMAAGKYAPSVKRHISTQAGIVSSQSANAWFDLGAKRVVLARELTLDEIASIRAHTDSLLEIETFVHGAMCVSFSGRCLLSNYMTSRDANRGACAQSCRWEYSLVEAKRPGEYMPVFEDDGGTYILNSKDLCMIEHLDKLRDAGVSSFKIEGRMKSAYYAAVVTGAYRRAIDDLAAGQPVSPEIVREVEKVSHRVYCNGFYFGKPDDAQYYEDSKYIRDWDVVAYVLSCDLNGNAVLTQRGRFRLGDELELLTPDGRLFRFSVDYMENGEGESIDYCPHAEMEIRLRLPARVPTMSILRKKNN